jgi:hypothetical protein
MRCNRSLETLRTRYGDWMHHPLPRLPRDLPAFQNSKASMERWLRIDKAVNTVLSESRECADIRSDHSFPVSYIRKRSGSAGLSIRASLAGHSDLYHHSASDRTRSPGLLVHPQPGLDEVSGSMVQAFMSIEDGKNFTTRHTGVNIPAIGNTTNIVLVFLPGRAQAVNSPSKRCRYVPWSLR